MCRLLSARKVRPRRTRPSRGNPLRTLHEQGLAVDEYVEVRTNVAQRELKRIKHEQSMYTVHGGPKASIPYHTTPCWCGMVWYGHFGRQPLRGDPRAEHHALPRSVRADVRGTSARPAHRRDLKCIKPYIHIYICMYMYVRLGAPIDVYDFRVKIHRIEGWVCVMLMAVGKSNSVSTSGSRSTSEINHF